MAFDSSKWPLKTELIEHVATLGRKTLEAYKANSILIHEHSNLERAISQGTYGRRQIYELIQNSADAMLDQPGGHIQVVLTNEHLYCANEGSPIDHEGVEAILHSHLSVKRGNEIGRFGLGFKSLLGITRQPHFFCRSGSFGFNADRSAKEIRAVLPSAPHTPVLRLAYQLDPVAEAENDPVLKELMAWATTVVRVDRNPSQSAWLSEDIAKFPSEFLLFCAHVGLVTLEDRPANIKRSIQIQAEGEEHRLSDGKDEMTWRVFKVSHRPSPEARKEAGELADREELPVIWAVPTAGRLPVGQFWAFFPLRDQTTLSGIVNAPWKTNDDRTVLLPGQFNKELLDVVAETVATNLPTLVKKADPGWILDVMPARGRESRCWADGELTERTYDRACGRPSLPDQNGMLVHPNELKLHPQGIPRSVLDLWSNQTTRPNKWCHPSVEGRERRPRAERLLGTVKPRTVPEWLTALIPDSAPASCIPAIRVAAALFNNPEVSKEYLDTIRSGIRDANILQDDQGNAAKPVPEKIFLPASHKIASRVIRLVHSALSSSKEVSGLLSELGIQPVSPELELASVLEEGIQHWDSNDGLKFWELVRRTPQDRAFKILEPYAIGGRTSGLPTDDEIRVRTKKGEFKSLRNTLLPGTIVPEEGNRDSGIAVDTQFHRQELELLKNLGAISAPGVGGGILKGSCFHYYKNEWHIKYCNSLPASSSRPSFNSVVVSKTSFAGPLEPFDSLSDEGKAAFTEALLRVEPDLSQWTMQHATRSTYPRFPCDSPAIWAIKKYGRVLTSLGPRDLHQAVGPALSEWGKLFPVANCTAASAALLGIANEVENIKPSHWVNAAAQALTLTSDELIGKFYALAVKHTENSPDLMRCRDGQQYRDLAPHDITVVSLPNEYKALIQIEKPVILVGDQQAARALVAAWKLLPSDKAVRTQLYHVPASEMVPLGDLLPALRWNAKASGATANLQVIPCLELRQETLTEGGKTSEPQEYWKDGDKVYCLANLVPRGLLEFLNVTIGLQLTSEKCEEILQQGANQERRRRLVAIRSQGGDAEKLLAAVGEKGIIPRLPSSLVNAVEKIHGRLTPWRAAELALVVYGVSALKEFRTELEQRGLQPPERWAGSSLAKKFVSELGFSRAYAGFEEARRDPVLSVDGPSKLPPLHDYQEKVTLRIRRLLSVDEDPRGLLSLPTGAGKTRVAVQALIDAMREGDLKSPVLWVAQSDELCEQAVQTWREVWSALGAEESLQISRLWSQNEVEEADGNAHVVVATIQKLEHVIEQEAYKWLANASALIIDEAHGATTPAYTRLLSWVGIDRKGTRCPLIGLTATPFRGRSIEETDRLAARFGRERLDPAMDGDPYVQLQKLGVLSKVEHQTLKGMRVDLTESELEELVKLRSVPASVYDRIAGDKDRNQSLLRSISALPRDWPVLLFAASVEHAQTIAALLSLDHIKAAPISANTEPGARQRYIQDFKKGKIQVLTNYNVLTQGFDAPATRAIYVARPTFSPNQYQQMIGRGLRGPKNGGKESCLIVNVEDNFAQYGEKLAFREFEHLWSRHD